MHKIIQKAQSGDRNAFKSLVEMHQAFAYRVAFRLLGHQDDARDAVQEAFIRVWKNLHRYDHRARFTTWFYKIIVNLCYDNLKSSNQRYHCSAHQNCVLVDESRDLEKIICNQDLVYWIRYFSEDLPPLQRTVFVLRDLEDLSIKEITDIINISKGSVKSNLYYARRQIREKMKAML